MPVAFAARVTLPVASKAVRKIRCLAGVQWARGGGEGDVLLSQGEPEFDPVGQRRAAFRCVTRRP